MDRYPIDVRPMTDLPNALEAPASAARLTPEQIRRLRARLRRLAGQARGIERMLEEGHSCNDILVQLAALGQAVRATAADLLACHLECCVAQASPDSTEVAELRRALIVLTRNL